MKKRIFTTFLSCIFLLSVSAQSRAEIYGSGWYREMQLSYGHEDNVSRSYKDEDQVSDTVSTVSFGGGHLRKLGRKGQFTVSGYLSYHDHDQFNDLDSIALTAGFNWLRQPSVGYNNYWYGVKANATVLQYKESDAREGLLFDLDLNINRRFGTRLVLHAGYRYTDLVFIGKEEIEELDDAAFDTAENEIYFGLDYELASSVFLFAEYGFRHGGITSTVSGGVDPLLNYTAETEDPVYDDCGNDPRCSVRFSYRIVSDTQRLNVGISFPVRNFNIDLAASYLSSEGEGQTYQDWIVKLGLVWNF